jgi:hypothetical protein
MNMTRFKKSLVVGLMLANGFFAVAQSTNVPGPAAYQDFSRFITERNIFNPNRYAHTSRTRTTTYRPRVTRSTPTFTLVGTMDYPKGMFAFFDGNDAGLRKVLYQSDSNNIAGYTVTEITLTGATLQSADKKQTVAMKIGEMMRQSGTEWQLAGSGELPASTADSIAPADASSSPAPGTVPTSAGEPNDILKKLMQQREKELK